MESDELPGGGLLDDRHCRAALHANIAACHRRHKQPGAAVAEYAPSGGLGLGLGLGLHIFNLKEQGGTSCSFCTSKHSEFIKSNTYYKRIQQANVPERQRSWPRGNSQT